MNYEVSDNYFTAYEDITAHVNLEDEKVRKSEDDNISPRVVFRAIRRKTRKLIKKAKRYF